MLAKLCGDRGWQGELFHLTTDPRLSPGDDSGVPNHALNVLEGIDPRSRISIQRVRQIAEALLPDEGLTQGETRVWRNNWLNWLTGLIHLAVLHEWYLPMAGGALDLSHVYDLASTKESVIACINDIDRRERETLEAGELPVEPGLATWFADVAVLLPCEVIVPPNKMHGRPALSGERAEHSYRWLTEPLTSALRPFRRHGLLHDKVSGFEDLPRFSLERLAGIDNELKPSREQITVVVAAREQELDDAQTLLTLVIVKLQHALYDRMRYAGTEQLKPILLLLDETRRIRNFKVHEYVSYAREAEAGCVVVFQSLDQIGTEPQIRELLSNIGTQIYLGSLSGTTAAQFISHLPVRGRRSFSFSTGPSDGTPVLQVSNREVPFFSTADLHVLPAGRYPALVYLREQPARAPILTSLDRDLMAVPNGEGGGRVRSGV